MQKNLKVTKEVTTVTGQLAGTGVQHLDGVIVNTSSKKFQKLQAKGLQSLTKKKQVR